MNTYGAIQYITNNNDSSNISAYEDVVEDTEEQNSIYATAIDCTTPLRNSIIRRRRLIETRRRNRAAIYNWKTFLLALLFLSGFFIGSYLLMHDCNEMASNFPFYLIELSEWYQEKEKSLSEKNLILPVPTLLVSHTRTNQCYDVDSCIQIINKLISDNLANSPFNFLISSDAKIYEIRGWRHKSGSSFQRENIFVGFIGNFTINELNSNQQLALEALIVEGRRRKYITSDYKIYGLRQNRIDGKNIFDKLSEMKHWHGYAES